MRTRGRAAGFTLIELMVVILIIGILGSVVGWNVMRWVDKAREARVDSDYQAVVSAVKEYRMTEGKMPRSIEDLKTPKQGSEALLDLANNPDFTDPWGNKYQVTFEAGNVTMRSLGPDGIQSDDDIARPAKKQ